METRTNRKRAKETALARQLTRGGSAVVNCRRVHCLGLLTMDGLCGPIKTYPTPRRQTMVYARYIRFMPGGGAVNSAAALAQLGVPVGLFVKVGADVNGRAALDHMQKLGVDVSGAKVSDRESTPFSFVGVHPNGDRSFIYTPGCDFSFKPSDINRQKLFSADFLLAQDLWSLPAMDGRPLAGLLAQAQRRGIITFLDECWGRGPDRRKLEQVLRYADYFLPSYDDVLSIYPGLKPVAMIRRLQQLGGRHIILKLGARGCLYDFGADCRRKPSVARDIIDSTGAGDCFDAGFIAGLANGLAPEDAVDIGLRTAAACMRNVGGAVGIPSFKSLYR